MYVTNVIKKKKKGQLENELIKDMNQTETTLPYFYHPDWYSFLSFLNPTWKVQSKDEIGRKISWKFYGDIIQRVIGTIWDDGGGVLGIEGVTNILEKSVSNVIVNLPNPLYIEHLGAAFKRKTTDNVVDNI